MLVLLALIVLIAAGGLICISAIIPAFLVPFLLSAQQKALQEAEEFEELEGRGPRSGRKGHRRKRQHLVESDEEAALGLPEEACADPMFYNEPPVGWTESA